MNTMNFGYRGSVTLNILIKDKIITLKKYNKGTEYLKKAFAKWLTGNFQPFDIPETLDFRYASSSEPIDSDFVTCLNQEIGLTGKVFVKATDENLSLEDAWVARFSASIPFSALSHNSFSNTESYRLYLTGSYDSEESTYHDLAYIPIDDEDLQNFTQGTQMIVEWNMELLNWEDYTSEGEE